MPRPRPVARNLEKPRAAAKPASLLPLVFLGVQLAGFVILVARFWLLYFTDAPKLTLQARRSALNFLVAPDHLLELWCGGRLADFSLLDRWPIALLAALILGGAWLAGRLLLEALSVSSLLSRLERAVIALGLGLNALSLYALAVGLLGFLQQRWVFVTPLVLLAVGNAWLTYRRRGETPQRASPPAPTGLNDRRWLWLLAAAAPFAMVIVVGGMLPPFEYDVREYHLQAPKEWFQNGRIAFLPHNIYANMPLGAELNSVWAMSLIGGTDGWWWGALAGKTVMGCYSLVTAAALVAFGRRVHSLAAGCIAAAVFLATPWTVVLAVTGYNESGVMLYALLAIVALWLAARPEHAELQWRFVLLAGLLAGSAVACKYPPALFLVVPLAAWTGGYFYLRPSRSLQRGLAFAAIFLAAAAASCGLWLAKNAAQTGNPVYPLLYSLFDGQTRTPEKDRQWTGVHSPQPDNAGRRFAPASLFRELAWTAWRTLLASSILAPLALLAALAAGLDRERRPFIAILAFWMLFVFLAWWLFTHRLDRFLLLLLPAASLLAACGALAIDHFAWRMVALAVIGWGLVSQFPFATLPLNDNRFFAPLAELRRDEERLAEVVGVRVNPGQRWLNEHAQSGERALLVGDAEPFELQIPAVYNTCFDDCQFERLFRGKSKDERLAALRREGIRYVLCHWSHLARYRSPGNYGYTSDYITPDLVHRELVSDQRLLRPIPIAGDPRLIELFEVVDLPNASR